MKKGFTLIEMVVALAITSIMIMILTSLISSVSQNYNNQSEIVDVTETLAVLETRYEIIVRNTNNIINIIDVGDSTSGYDGCYYYDHSSEELRDGVTNKIVDGSPSFLSKNYKISSIKYSTVSGVGNAINISFYIQNNDSGSESMYQEIVLSTLNPNVDVFDSSTSSDQMLCVKYKNN